MRNLDVSAVEGRTIVTPLLRGAAKFGRDRDRFCEIGDGTIPFSNCSQSVKNSWFVPISTLLPTENAKSLASLFRGESEIWVR